MCIATFILVCLIAQIGYAVKAEYACPSSCQSQETIKCDRYTQIAGCDGQTCVCEESDACS